MITLYFTPLVEIVYLSLGVIASLILYVTKTVGLTMSDIIHSTSFELKIHELHEYTVYQILSRKNEGEPHITSQKSGCMAWCHLWMT